MVGVGREDDNGCVRQICLAAVQGPGSSSPITISKRAASYALMDSESSQTPQPAAPIRSEGLWFSDGGLILQAEDRLFRVAGSVLGARSSVFRDMLSIPQPDNQPLIEGCPVVTLHDSAKDVDFFLRAIFDSGFFERPPAPTTLDIVSGVLRLSTKYDVGYLRRRALLHLATVSACTLEEHTSIASTATFDSKRGLMSRAMLASEFNLQWAQLPAMYRISTCAVEQIMDGALTLSPPFALQRTCIAAHCSLRLAQTTETFSFLRPLSVPGCHFPDTCHHLRHNLYEKLCSHQRVDPLGCLRPKLWSGFLQPRLCPPCYTAAETTYAAARRRIWDDLPELFNISLSWEALRLARDADLNAEG